jgi:hypothetical protein
VSGGEADSRVAYARARIADLEALAGVQAVTLADGPGRGVRLLQVRSGGGLEFEVVVDRGFDIGRVSFGGQTASWHSATGVVAPWLMHPAEDAGQGFLRGFTGFMTTCGLDHIRQPETVPVAGQALNPNREIAHPLHGLHSTQPARLIGSGCDADRPRPLLWCEAEIRQAIIFGTCLSLRRRYECFVGAAGFTVSDRVKNIGPTPAPHLVLYHINLGYPLIDDASVPTLAGATEVWRLGEGEPLAAFEPPVPEQTRALGLYRWDDGNPRPVIAVAAASGLRMEIAINAGQLPFCQVLRIPSTGHYGLSIEPCSTSSRTRREADESGETRILLPGEEVRYDLGFSFSA